MDKKLSVLGHQRETLQTLLSDHSDIGIVIGRDDIDTMAAALALSLSLSSFGKHTQVVSKREPIVEQAYLVGIDRIKKKFDGIVKTLTISIPYKEGEIEKVSYNIDQDRLFVNLFAEKSGISFDEKTIQFLKKGSAPSLLFAFGVPRVSDLEGFVGESATYKIVNIDNNPTNTVYGDIVLVSQEFSSLCEVTAITLEELMLPVDIDIAQNLLDGVLFATKNFARDETSPFAFAAAAFLMQQGAQRGSARKQGSSRGSFFGQDALKTKQEVFSQEEVSRNEEQEIEEVPGDWFAPKVFKSSKKQE